MPGHGLNYENMPLLFRVPHLVELNIGHSIISRAVMTGLDAAVKDMLQRDEGLSRLRLEKSFTALSSVGRHWGSLQLSGSKTLTRRRDTAKNCWNDSWHRN